MDSADPMERSGSSRALPSWLAIAALVLLAARVVLALMGGWRTID